MEGPLPFPSPLTPPIVPFGNGRFNPTPDPTWSAAFSPFCFRVNPLMLLSSKPWLLLDLDARRTVTWNIHSNRQIGLFGPSLFPGTMTSADSSHFDFLGVALCEVSWDKSMLFPRLPL